MNAVIRASLQVCAAALAVLALPAIAQEKPNIFVILG